MIRRNLLPLGVALLFLVAVAVCAAIAMPNGPMQLMIVLAALAAGYMALNIGANDVANNMGPAVGAKALTMGSALIIAAIFDAAGAILAGRDVVDTVANQLLTSSSGIEPASLVLIMIAALLAAAAWINLSTFVGAPVSTTHAIIGGIVGAAVAAAGWHAVDWSTIRVIAVTWTLSPLLGGVLAAGLHTLIRRFITRRPDKVAAARTWVPVLCGLMAGVFAAYLATRIGGQTLGWHMLLLGLGFAMLGWLIAGPWVREKSRKLENRKKQVARLFRPPLVVAAALLSFAHGANDVANTLGPLAAILAVTGADPSALTLSPPVWAVLTGAFGIALGLLLFGPRVIHTIGEQITKLNEIRAFCVALSAATTVLLASAFGLPVSSTHVAVGAVFGVGFLREYLAIRNMHGAAVPVETSLLDASMLNNTPQQAIARERRDNRRFLVRRLKVLRIGAAWLVTLPASAGLSAGLYLLLSATIA